MAEPTETHQPAPGSATPATLDRLQNLAIGFGGPADRLRATTHVLGNRLTRFELDALYTESWMAAAIVDAIPNDMVREWRTITGIEGPQLKTFQAAEKHFRVKRECTKALKWARLYGGAGIVLGLDNTGEFHEPLDLERVRPGSLKYLSTLDRWALIPHHLDSFNPLREDWQQPEFYRTFGGPDLVHRSRIIFFYGHDLPWHLAIRELFWGGSALIRVMDAVNDAMIVTHGTAALVTEAKVDVWKIPELFAQLATPEGTKTITDRIQLAQQIKSIYNAVIMDKAEEWEQKKDALSQGLPKLVGQFLEIVAAAAEIPVQRFLGTSAPGLNATGAENTRNYYDRVKAAQGDQLAPALAVLDEVVLRSTVGSTPEEFESTFTTLWMETESERSTTQATDATRDTLLLQAGVIQEHHIASRLVAEKIYPTLDEEDVRELEAIGTFEPAPDPFAGFPAPGETEEEGEEEPPAGGGEAEEKEEEPEE